MRYLHLLLPFTKFTNNSSINLFAHCLIWYPCIAKSFKNALDVLVCIETEHSIADVYYTRVDCFLLPACCHPGMAQRLLCGEAFHRVDLKKAFDQVQCLFGNCLPYRIRKIVNRVHNVLK